MSTHRAAIRIMDALRQAEAMRLSSDGGTPVIVIDDEGRRAVDAVRMIAEAIDARVILVDADRTNFNDLEVRSSPLRIEVDHAARAAHRHMFLVRGGKATAEDRRMSVLRILLGPNADLILVTDEDADPHIGWARCDLA